MKLTFDQIDNVETLETALSDVKGDAVIQQSIGGISSKVKLSTDGIPNKVDTIDKLFKDKPISYIKADLEGFDLQMIKGARETIIKNKPKIAITTYHRKDHAELISEFLRSIVLEYNIRVKGIELRNGSTIMLHAWIKEND